MKKTVAALGILVAVLIFGSVQTTGARWAERSQVAIPTVGTGTIGLAPGSGSGSSFTFPALAGNNLAPSDSKQAVLTISNTGTTPLRFRLATAGPTVTTPGSTVVVNLAGSVGSTCPDSGSSPSGAFAAQDTSNANTSFTSPWHALARGASTAWCIRATLIRVAPISQATTFTINFEFAAEQTQP